MFFFYNPFVPENLSINLFLYVLNILHLGGLGLEYRMVNKFPPSLSCSPQQSQGISLTVSDLGSKNQNKLNDIINHGVQGGKSRKRSLFCNPIPQQSPDEDINYPDMNKSFKHLLQVVEKVSENEKEETINLDFIGEHFILLRKDIRMYRQNWQKIKSNKDMNKCSFSDSQEKTTIFKNISQLIDSVIAFKEGEKILDQRANESRSFNQREFNQYGHESNKSTQNEGQILFLLQFGK